MGTTRTRTKPPVAGRYDPLRPGRRIAHARDDRGQSVDELAELIKGATGIYMTGQIIKNMEAGRRRVDAALIPVFASLQGKSLDHYLVDDPGHVSQLRAMPG